MILQLFILFLFSILFLVYNKRVALWFSWYIQEFNKTSLNRHIDSRTKDIRDLGFSNKESRLIYKRITGNINEKDLLKLNQLLTKTKRKW
tara:strand:+ start:4517 stop:4786 length:270 start_codon:yes stop_codon:yes gene_type:complete